MWWVLGAIWFVLGIYVAVRKFAVGRNAAWHRQLGLFVDYAWVLERLDEWPESSPGLEGELWLMKDRGALFKPLDPSRIRRVEPNDVEAVRRLLREKGRPVPFAFIDP